MIIIFSRKEVMKIEKRIYFHKRNNGVMISITCEKCGFQIPANIILTHMHMHMYMRKKQCYLIQTCYYCGMTFPNDISFNIHLRTNEHFQNVTTYREDIIDKTKDDQ